MLLDRPGCPFLTSGFMCRSSTATRLLFSSRALSLWLPLRSLPGGGCLGVPGVPWSLRACCAAKGRPLPLCACASHSGCTDWRRTRLYARAQTKKKKKKKKKTRRRRRTLPPWNTNFHNSGSRPSPELKSIAAASGRKEEFKNIENSKIRF